MREGVLGSEVNDMRESLQHRPGPWRRYIRPRRQRNTGGFLAQKVIPRRMQHLQAIRAVGFMLFTAVLLLPVAAHAQAPWERAASNLERTFTGPLARSLALVAIVIGGLMFMFGEAGAKRQISGIVFGGGLALFAAQFLTWLF